MARIAGVYRPARTRGMAGGRPCARPGWMMLTAGRSERFDRLHVEVARLDFVATGGSLQLVSAGALVCMPDDLHLVTDVPLDPIRLTEVPHHAAVAFLGVGRRGRCRSGRSGRRG